MISYDMDTSLNNRKEVPLFYGYIKDSNSERGITFVLLILLASFHNLSRTIGTALMLSVSGKVTFMFMGAEMLAYHLYKMGRADYVIWVPGLHGFLKYFIAFMLHSVVKILVDFTGLVHARGPKLTGGGLFSFLTINSQCLPFIALVLYSASTSIENKMATGELTMGFSWLSSMWVICAITFAFITKREYWDTFTSTATGKQFTCDCFQASADPFSKMMTAFDNHISFTASIKDEVRAYVHLHWEEFETSQPDWFTPGFIAQVPDWYIPKQNLDVLNANGEGGVRARRRSSLGREFGLGVELNHQEF